MPRGKRGSGRRRLRELTRSVVETMEILEQVREKHSGVGGMSKALIQVSYHMIPHTCQRYSYTSSYSLEQQHCCTALLYAVVCCYEYRSGSAIPSSLPPVRVIERHGQRTTQQKGARVLVRSTAVVLYQYHTAGTYVYVYTHMYNGYDTYDTACH